MSTIDPATARARARDAARILATDPRVRLVFLFGSSVLPGDVPCRDVDLAILARPAIEFDERLRLMGELATLLGLQAVPGRAAPHGGGTESGATRWSCDLMRSANGS